MGEDARGPAHWLELAQAGLLPKIWPPERVLLGASVCTWMRNKLLYYADTVRLAMVDTQIDGDTMHHRLLKYKGKHIELVHRGSQVGSVLDGISAALADSEVATAVRFVLLEFSANNLVHEKLGVDGAAQLSQILFNCSALTHLDLSWNKLADTGIEHLWPGLKSCESLKTLVLEGNGIGEEGTGKITSLCQKSTALTDLQFRFNQAVFTARYESCPLRRIDVSSNDLGDVGATAFASFLAGCTALEELRLSLNHIQAAGSEALCGVMSMHNTSLKSLVFAGNSIGCDGAQHLSQVLQRCTELESIDLSWDRLGGSGAWAGGLAELRHLKRLDVSRNALEEEGAARLGGKLEDLISLTDLRVGGNELGPRGVRWVLKGLRGCDKLATLHLGSNAIGPDGAEALLTCLRPFTALTDLDLSSNGLGGEGGDRAAAAIIDSLAERTALTRLDVSRCGLRSQSCEVLATVLMRCTRLAHLGLAGNQLGEEAFELLTGALQRCEVLQELDVSDNKIGAASAKKVMEALGARTNKSTVPPWVAFMDNCVSEAEEEALCELSALHRVAIDI